MSGKWAMITLLLDGQKRSSAEIFQAMWSFFTEEVFDNLIYEVFAVSLPSNKVISW